MTVQEAYEKGFLTKDVNVEITFTGKLESTDLGDKPSQFKIRLTDGSKLWLKNTDEIIIKEEE
jgi:hypothetical protein